MIVARSGNLLDDDAPLRVIPVNTVGVLGAGLAHEFRQRHPDLFRPYARACRVGDLREGTVLELADQAGRRWLMVPTKRHWRRPSDLALVATSVAAMLAHLREHPAAAIAVPALGCGLGGLAWAEVRPIIEAAAASLPEVEWRIYPPPTEASTRPAA